MLRNTTYKKGLNERTVIEDDQNRLGWKRVKEKRKIVKLQRRLSESTPEKYKIYNREQDRLCLLFKE